jgi:uncharacterized protein (UPF0332 family)
MTLSLQQWLENKWLVETTASGEEVHNLSAIAERDIEAASNQALPPEWQLNIAFNAVLQIATAALIVSGYRVTTKSHHYHAIESLRYTIGTSTEIVEQLQRFSKKRNVASYERVGMVTEGEVAELLALARTLHAELQSFVRRQQ